MRLSDRPWKVNEIEHVKDNAGHTGVTNIFLIPFAAFFLGTIWIDIITNAR